MKTLVFAPLSNEGLLRLQNLGSVIYEPWTQTKYLYDPLELGLRVENEQIDALVVEVDFLFAELFEVAKRLRVAVLCRTALHHVDLESATEHGVTIIHTPGRNSRAVAEMVFGLMLSLARNIPEAHSYVQNGQWEDPIEAYTAFQGRELAGETLGIIGLGKIGQHVGQLGRNFGMKILAHDPYLKPSVTIPEGVSLTTIDRLLAESDFVTIHVPENEGTKGLLNSARLALLRPSSYLINTSSPNVLDINVLATALTNKAIAGAAIDVHETHPMPPNSPLLRSPNVILTPHIGGATVQTISRYSTMLATDLERFASGRRPLHLANPAIWKVKPT